MWRIPLFMVHEALRLRAAEFKATAALKRARELAAGDARLEEAIIEAFYAGRHLGAAGLTFKPRAIGSRV